MQRFRNRHPRSSPGRNRSTQQIQYQRKKKAATKVRGCISMSCVSETSPEKKSDLQSDSKPNDSSNPIRPPMQEVSKFSITTCSTNENEHAPNALRTPISLRRLRNCVRVIPIILRAGNNKEKGSPHRSISTIRPRFPH